VHKPADGDRAGSPVRIFVHCATSVPYLAELSATIPGLRSYSERALLLAEGDDIVCVSDEIDSDYLDYLRDLGIGPASDRVIVASRFGGSDAASLLPRLLDTPSALDSIADLIRPRGPAQLHPFIASPGQFTLGEALAERAGVPVTVVGGDPGVVAFADCKHHVRALALELGVPVAAGEVVHLDQGHGSREREYELLRRAIERQMPATGRVIVRGSAGASGSTTFVAGAAHEEAGALARRLVSRGHNRIYLVEAMVEATSSPNILMHISPDDRSITCLGVTDQRWEQALVHGGNVSPSSAVCTEDMLTWARRLSDWLRDSGYTGPVGFDFVEHKTATRRSAFLAEVNPRVNGVAYPLGLAKRLNLSRSAFCSGAVDSRAMSFGQLREELSDVLYQPGMSSGIVPYGIGRLQYGKCGVVALAPTSAEAVELYHRARFMTRWLCLAS
jgi:Pre ATP-grasp domain/ATP-grasp domain